jgi:hypothetical protein
MADGPNHEFMNPLRRADEARIARSMKPAQRVHEQESARAERLEQRAAQNRERPKPQTVPRTVQQREPPRTIPRTAVPETRRVPARQGQRGRPGWVVLLAVLTMAAGFAGALYYLGSADLGNSNDSPVTIENWDLKGK